MSHELLEEIGIESNRLQDFFKEAKELIEENFNVVSDLGFALLERRELVGNDLIQIIEKYLITDESF